MSNTKDEFKGLRAAIFPIHKYELKKFIPLTKGTTSLVDLLGLNGELTEKTPCLCDLNFWAYLLLPLRVSSPLISFFCARVFLFFISLFLMLLVNELYMKIVRGKPVNSCSSFRI